MMSSPYPEKLPNIPRIQIVQGRKSQIENCWSSRVLRCRVFQTRKWGPGNEVHGVTHEIASMDRMIGGRFGSICGGFGWFAARQERPTKAATAHRRSFYFAHSRFLETGPTYPLALPSNKTGPIVLQKSSAGPDGRSQRPGLDRIR